MFDFHTPYTDMVAADIKRELSKLKSKPKVLHRMTCPCCNENLVNLYFSDLQDRYICKECLERSNNNV